MDKYEYKVRAEEIKSLIAEGEFAEAVKIADTIDWRRVKSVMMLCTISDLYKINRRFQESKDILLMAYERHPGGRLIVYSLCELSIKMGETVQAIEYYKEFVQIAPKDTGRYILQYKLYEAQDVSLEERIAVLEEFKKRDYREKWAYELAYLYHRVGLETKCVEECDEMVLWFGEGRYIIKALELKMLHQSLSAAQQEKYTQLKQEAERQLMEADEDDTEDENAEEDIREDISGNDDTQAEMPQEEPYPEAAINSEINKVTEFPGYGGTADAVHARPEEEEFRVKTVDVGQYNTINLQRALAESMKEILGDDENQEEETKEDSEAEHSSITQSIIAPLLQETEDIPPLNDMVFSEAKKTEEVQKEEAAPQLQIPESQIQEPQLSEPRTEMEEVFFEEDVKDVLLEDTKEINLGDAVIGNLGDTKELNPKRRIIYPSVSPANTPMQEEAPQTITTEPVLMKIHKPSGFEQMLSQEYDGQISLVVPNRDEVEKQITGQMNIADIMVEWERMKRENEEKRREDVRRRVEQHTGNMFSEFDEAMRNGLLEQLNDIAKNVENAEAEAQKKPKESAPEILPTAEDRRENTAEAGIADSVEADATGGIEAAETVEEAVVTGETTDMAEKLSQIMGAVQESSSETNKLRPFTEEERELFGRFAHNKKTKEQIIQAIDIMSMDSYSGNVIVTGEEGAGTLELAKSLVRMLQMTDSNFSGKVAKISGETLNKKDIPLTLSKLVDGALIIEHATDMASGTATDLNKALAKENSGLFVVMEGRKEEMNIFLRRNGVLMDNFNAKIDIEALDDQSLVEYARQYAEEMEYSIDELGILALHTRIADMQTSDHEVTVAEVRDLVDDAIYFADKKNPKHFFDLLFGKRYDEEDMIILREKDFMHY